MNSEQERREELNGFQLVAYGAGLSLEQAEMLPAERPKDPRCEESVLAFLVEHGLPGNPEIAGRITDFYLWA